MRKETVEEYLRRGKTITKIPQVLDTIGSIWNQQGYEVNKDRHGHKKFGIRLQDWKSMQPDIRFDTEDDDRKYWNKLNKKCDKILKKMKCQEIDTKKYPTEKVPVSRKGKVGRPSGIAGGKYHKVG